MRKVEKDFALLDRGAEEDHRFVVIEDIEVDDNGHLLSGIDVSKVLSDEAVKDGATRIPHSNCVDTSTGGRQSANDVISVWNGGDSYVAGDSAQDLFLISEGLLK